MNNPTVNISLHKAAIVAGTSILVMTTASIVSTDLTIGSLIVPDDAISTTNNIQQSELLFRIGIFSWFIILITDILAAWGLYLFFKPVHVSLSLLTAWFRIIYAAMLGTSILNYVEVTSLLGIGANRLESATEQIWPLIQTFDDTWSFSLMVFGFHVLVLGYLVYISGYSPKWLGVLLIISFGGYLMINATQLLFPDYEGFISILTWIFILPMVIGEVGLGFWLLIKGKNVVVEGLNPA